MLWVASNINRPSIFDGHQHGTGIRTVMRAGRTNHFPSLGSACHSLLPALTLSLRAWRRGGRTAPRVASAALIQLNAVQENWEPLQPTIQIPLIARARAKASRGPQRTRKI